MFWATLTQSQGIWPVELLSKQYFPRYAEAVRAQSKSSKEKSGGKHMSPHSENTSLRSPEAFYQERMQGH